MRILLSTHHTPLLSEKAVLRLRALGAAFAADMQLKGESNCCGVYTFNNTWLGYLDGQRHDPLMLQVFDELGQEAFDKVFDDIEYEVKAVQTGSLDWYRVEDLDGREVMRSANASWTAEGLYAEARCYVKAPSMSYNGEDMIG